MRKSPAMLDFFDSLHNASLFCPRSGPKSCRCAAQTPADTGFLQAFNPTRGGSRPLVLPLQKRTLFLQAGFFDKLRDPPVIMTGGSLYMDCQLSQQSSSTRTWLLVSTLANQNQPGAVRR